MHEHTYEKKNEHLSKEYYKVDPGLACDFGFVFIIHVVLNNCLSKKA